MAAVYTPKFGLIDVQSYAYPWALPVGNDYLRFSYTLGTNKGNYVFIPLDWINRGTVYNGKQYFQQMYTNRTDLENLYKNGQVIDFADFTDFSDGQLFQNRLKEYNLGTTGILVPEDYYVSNFQTGSKPNVQSYSVGRVLDNGVVQGAIQGMGELDGGLVYVPSSSGGGSNTNIYIRNEDGKSMTRSVTYYKKGGLLGSIIRGIAGIPLLPEIVGAITKSPMVYASLKGFQGGFAGKDPLQVALEVGLTVYAGSLKDFTSLGQAIGIADPAIAKIAGSAIANSAMSGVMAAATGGEIGKSMLAGAARGAGIAGAGEIASTLLGDQTIQSIVNSTNLTKQDVETIFASSLIGGVTAAIKDEDFGQAMINGLIAGGVSQTLANQVKDEFLGNFKDNPEVLSGIITATRETAKTATNAALNNQDIGKAIEDAVPGIILSTVRSYDTALERVRTQRKIDEKAAEIQRISQEATRIATEGDQVAALPMVAIGVSAGAHAALAWLLYQYQKMFPDDPALQKQAIEQNKVYINLIQNAPSEIKTVTNPDTNKTELKLEFKPDFKEKLKEEPEVTQQFYEKIDAQIGGLSEAQKSNADDVYNALVTVFEESQAAQAAREAEKLAADQAEEQRRLQEERDLQLQQTIDAATKEDLAINPVVVNGQYLVVLPTGEKVFASEQSYKEMQDAVKAASATPPSSPPPQPGPTQEELDRIAEETRIAAEEERIRQEIAKQQADELAAEQARLEAERLDAIRRQEEEEAQRIADEQARIAEQERIAREEAERARLAAEQFERDVEAARQRQTTPISFTDIALQQPTQKVSPNLEQFVYGTEGQFDYAAQEKFYSDQAVAATQEIDRLQRLKTELNQTYDSFDPAIKERLKTEYDTQIKNLDDEIARVGDIAREAAAQSGATAQERQDFEDFLQEIEAGRTERISRAVQTRYERDMARLDAELQRLEDDLAKAESTQAASTARQRFVESQRERLRVAERLPGTLEEQINNELESILRSYEQSKTAAGRTATQIKEIGAAQQKAEEERGAGRVSDAEVMRLLGLDGGEAARYGFAGEAGGEGATGEGGEGAGMPGEGEAGTGGMGAGEGTGEGEGVGEGEGIGTGEEPTPTGQVLRPTVIREPRTRAAGEITQTVSPRVTGEALASILGEKEPLFGGDEDEQRAVWNRRSLRLRRALGL